MFKVYDPFFPLTVLAVAQTLEEAFYKAKQYAKARHREQWVDSPRGTLCAVAKAI